MPSISVCIATYNGQQYISNQLQSISRQLGQDDEIIVVDDHSTDRTADIVRSVDDPRIKLFEHSKNLGYVKTFEDAISKATNDIIMLSDQDDVWAEGRVTALAQALKHCECAVGNFDVFGSEPNWFHQRDLDSSSSSNNLSNIIKTLIGVQPYYGCTMAFRSSFCKMLLPFPSWLTETHDQWIAICANMCHSIAHVDSVVTHRRLHSMNTTPKQTRPLHVILKSRCMLSRAVAEAWQRSRKFNMSSNSALNS